MGDEDSEGRPRATEPAPKSLTASTDSVPNDGDVPAIFPRRQVRISEYRRMRRPRLEYLAGCRRARNEHWTEAA